MLVRRLHLIAFLRLKSTATQPYFPAWMSLLLVALLLVGISTAAHSQTQDQCALTLSIAPASPVPFGQPVTITVSRNFPAMETVTAPVYLDGQQFCTYANPFIDPADNTCPANGTVFNNLATGNHTASWTCTVINDPQAGPPVSGSQSFSVADAPAQQGSVNPKFIVLSVIYAPPGAKSFVDYGQSTMMGVTTSIDKTFSQTTNITASIQLGPQDITENSQITVSAARTKSFKQELVNSSSIAINKTTTSDITTKGPENSSQGINHDYDVILLWLNPRIDLSLTTNSTGGTTGAWTGYTFDPADPANEVDVMPVYVAWLKDPSTMPAGVAAALGRTWAQPQSDGSGSGLTQSDFDLILAKDPFANGSTTIDATRFDRTGQTFTFAPPPKGGQPITEKFSLAYQETSTQGKTVTDETKTTFTLEGSVSFVNLFKASLSHQNITDITSVVANTNTQVSAQKATLSLTGPAGAYKGPTDLQVYQDNIYGTFMFSFVPNTQPSFALSATPVSQLVAPGGSATYTVTTSALNGFNGTIALSESGSPCGGVTFNPSSITGSGSSIMTVPACTTPGDFTIGITGSSGLLSDSTEVRIEVSSAPFLILASPTSQAINNGQSTSYTVSSVQSPGFTGAINLGISGLPTGASASFNPVSITSTNKSILTITTSSSTPQGVSTVTITGTSGSFPQATTSADLVVSNPPGQTGVGCTVGITLSPSTPVEGQPTTYTAAFLTVPGNSASGSVLLDNQPLCAASGNSCSATQNAPASGTHALQWQCTSSGSAGNGTGSGTQTFGVAASGVAEQGVLKPKFVVLSVVYAPPGQTSNVDYSSSSALGTSASIDNSFSSTTTTSVSVGGGISIAGILKTAVTATKSKAVTQILDTVSSIEINKTNAFDLKVPGPATSADGIDHDFDVILVWLNPIIKLTITGKNTAQWTGFGFDEKDPANEVDVVPLYVSWLKDRSTMPADIAAALARTWADPLIDGSGPELTDADLQTILKRDPFTDPAYVLTLAPGALTTDDKRFDLQIGQTLAYEPPPQNGQPFTEQFGLSYKDTATEGLKATDEFIVGFGAEFGADLTIPITKWIELNLNSKVSQSKELDWKNIASHSGSLSTTLGATLSLTGPGPTYTGPTDLQVFKDNVYGTFMFAFSPFASTSDFALWSTPDSQTVAPGGSTTYQISALSLTGFAAPVALTISGLPSGLSATFSPSSISGTASSTLTINAAPSTALGPYTLTITGTSGALVHTTVIEANVDPATFQLTGAPGLQTILAGESATFSIGSTPIAGFTGSVNLTASGLPSGVSASFSPASISGTTVSTLTLTASSAVASGSYPITITGASGSITQSETVLLVVSASPFFLTVSPPARSILTGETATFVVGATRLGGFNGNISVSVSGLPMGVTATVTPFSVLGFDLFTVSVSTALSTPPGSYSLTLNGSSSGQPQATTTVTVLVSLPLNTNSCTVDFDINPEQPMDGQAVTVTGTIQGVPAGDTAVAGISFDGPMFCGASDTTPCVATTPPLSAGIHTLRWSCTLTTPNGQVTGSGSQLLGVGASGSINPKYVVLSVIYAPPGSGSSVDYGNSTTLGTSISYSDSFSEKTFFGATLGGGVTFKIPDVLKLAKGFDILKLNATLSASESFAQTLQDDLSIAVSKTETSDIVVPGPKTSSTAINHDYDIVLLWINPVSNLIVTGPNSALWTGYTFDPADPVNEVDVVPVYVAWLKNPSLMPPGVRFALARTWATDPDDGSGSALTTDDFQNILARDPFANGAATVDPIRFQLTGETFSFAPPPNGGQPFTESLALAYQVNSQQTLQVKDTYQVAYTIKAPEQTLTAVKSFFKGNLNINPLKVGSNPVQGNASQSISLSNTIKRQSTETVNQSASLSLVGPAAGYTGPTDLQVFQDNVYGTFLFSFVPVTTFHVSTSASSQTTTAGGLVNYPVSTTTFASFTGPIVFSTNGLPAGTSGSFSPASLGGVGSSTLTVNVGTTVPVGIYPFSILGTVTTSGGDEIHAASARLVVVPPNAFLLTVSPAIQTVQNGDTTSYVVSTEAMPGFTGTVNLSVNNFIMGDTASFNPPSISGIGTSIMTIFTSTDAPIGFRTLTINGTSPGLPSATAQTDLVVTEPTTSTGTGCSVSVDIQPPAPIPGQLVTYLGTVNGLAAGNTGTVTLNLDHQSLCTGGNSCSVVQNTPPQGTHVVEWSCTSSGNAGSGTGSGTQTFIVGPAELSGNIKPKYIVLSVIYTPPGQKSTVDYSSSTKLGTSTTITNSFQTSPNVTATIGPPKGTPIPGSTLPNQGFPQQSVKATFTEQKDDSTSISVNKTDTYDIQVPGLANPSDGINHDYDVILLWINPVVNLKVTGNSTAQLPGYSFDANDPANEVDVVPVYVKWLKDAIQNPGTLPPGVAKALLRLWAEPPTDGSGSGLTASDFQEILKADPFTDPHYVLTVPSGQTTSSDKRFDLQAGESFAYAPPPRGGQPINEKFSLQYQLISSLGQTATDQHQVGFSLEESANRDGLGGFLNRNLKIANTLTWMNKVQNQTTETLTQTATLSLTGPCYGYVGPTDVQVLRDNVYGTFMFTFVNGPTAPDFSLCASPSSLPINTGSSDNFTISTSPINGFTGAVALSVTGLPAGVTPIFNPVSIPGATGSSILTLNVAASAAAGTYAITITGVSGSVTHAVIVTLVINAVPVFAVAASPGSASVPASGNASYTVSTSAFNGFTGNLSLSVTGLPAGATGSFSPASIAAGGTSTLTVTTSSSVPGNYALTITGTGGGVTQTASATLVVKDFSLSASPATQAAVVGGNAAFTVTTSALNGFADSVSLTISGLPTGATANFSPTSVTGSGSSTLTVTTSASTPVGNYTLTITGTDGSLARTTSVTLAVTDFSVTIAPTTRTTVAGGSVTYTVTTAAVNGFAGIVTPSVTGLPSGASATFSPATITGAGSSTLTVTTSSSTPGANSTLTITGASGPRSKTATATLTVTTFSITATPASQTVTAGSSTSYTVTATAANGFTGSIALSASGLPSGATAAFSPASITNSGSSTMTVSTTTATAGGNSTVTIAGTNGAGSQNAAVTLAIRNFALTATPATQSVVIGGSTTYTVTSTAFNGLTGNVTLSVTGLPTGATASFNPSRINGSTGTSTLTVTTSSTTPAANSTLSIKGTNGSLVQTVPVTLNVVDFGMTLTPASQTVVAGSSTTFTVTTTAVNGFNGSVTLSASGLPSGATATFSPTSITGAGTSTMTVATTSATPGANSTLTVTGASASRSHTATATLAVTNFSISATPATQTITAGASTTYSVTTTAANGFTGAEALTVTGLPAGATASFSPATITGGAGTSTLTVTTTAATPGANSTLTITGTSGADVHSTTVTLAVRNFTLTTTPATQQAVLGGSTTYTVTSTAVNGLTGNVALTVSGLPAGATAAFNPSTITGSTGTSTLTVTVSGTTPTANSTLTIAGTNGTLAHTATVTLSVVDFNLTAAPASQSVTAGGSTTYTVTTTAVNGFSGPVALSVSGLPTGATASFNPTSISGAGTSTLTVTTTSSTPGGNATLTITGASAGRSKTATVTLLVVSFTISAAPASQTVTAGSSTAYTVSISAVNGFSGTITLTASGLPSGATASFNPATLSGTGTSTMTVTTTAATPGANSTLAISGTSGGLTQSTAVTLAVQNFSLSATPASQQVLPGASVSYTITSSPQNGFAGSVALAVAGLPSGTTASFSPASIAGGSGTSTLTVTTTSATPAANSTLTITGTSGTLAQPTTTTLNVVDFNVAVTPASQTVTAGSSTSYTVTTTAVNGFTGTVTLSASGLPAGATANFSPASITGSGTSTLTVNTSATTPGVSSTLTVAGASGIRSQPATATLAVQSFTVAVTPSSQTVLAGSSTTYTVTTTATNGFAGAQTLNVSGLPSGATASFSPATIAGGSGTSTLTVTTSTATAGANSSLTISAVNGADSQSTTVTLAVQNFQVTPPGQQPCVLPGGSSSYPIGITAQNGFAGTVSFNLSGLPTGASGSFSPATVNGTGTSMLTAATATSTPAATSTLTITATSGTAVQTTTAQLCVFDFNVAVTPSSQTVSAGNGAAYTVTVTALNGFTGTVTPGVSGLPAGAGATFSPTTITGGSGTATMTVTTSGTTPAANSTLTVTGTSGARSRTATATLGVTDFSIAVTPSSQNVTAGNSTTYTITVTALNGFTGSVPLSATGLPSGATASFSPATIAGSGASTMTVTTLTTTPAGTFSLGIAGNSGGVPTHSASASLVVVLPLVILRPTVDTAVNIAYTNPANAQDGNAGTFASGTLGGGFMGRSGEIWSGFGAGPSPRSQITLKISSAGNCGNSFDQVELYYSLDGGGTWNVIYAMGVSGGACVNRPLQTDAFSLAVGQDLTRVQVKGLFNSPGGSSHQVYDAWIEVQ